MTYITQMCTWKKQNIIRRDTVRWNCQQDAHPEEPEDVQIDKWQQEQLGSSEKKLVLTHIDHLLQEDESQELKWDVVKKEPKQAEADDTEEPQKEVTQQDGVN